MLLLDHIEELQKYWCMILWYISFKLVSFNISAGKWGSSTSWYSEISLIIHELTLTLYIMIFQMSLYIFIRHKPFYAYRVYSWRKMTLHLETTIKFTDSLSLSLWLDALRQHN